MKRTQLLFLFLCTCSLASMAQTDYTLVMDRIRQDQLAGAGNISVLDTTVAITLANLKANGSWPDVNYSSGTSYQGALHIDRMKKFVLAYAHSSSAYYHSDTLFDAITRSLNYWDSHDPISWNWFHNEIYNPQRLGEILIILENGPDTLPATLRSNLISQMNRGNAAAKTGANKVDIATHYIYRAALTANATLMNTGATEAFQPIAITTSEGLQPDMSFQQHGPQLYLYSYGAAFALGEINAAFYLQGTPWALSGTKLALFSKFMRQAFLKVLRYKYIDFNTGGRAIARVGSLTRAYTAPLTKWMALDTAYAAEYDTILARHSGSQPASYGVTPFHSHFWHSDYSVHQRPGYFFGLRNVSTRTAKAENGNGENLKGYYLTEGATCIMTKGSEYYDIFPTWDWTRIPGTTVPVLTTLPVRSAWGSNMGKTAHTGGVSDSVYGATALAFDDYNTTARKAWFFFDDEVVCLGGKVKSTASQAINTTVNQCLQSGNVTVFANGSQSTLSSGSHTFNNTLKWVQHDNVGYYFPSGGNIHLTNQAQSGTWRSINNGGSTATQTKNVFKLWFDHGVAPTDGSYVYYVVPGQNMATYDTSQIRVEYNTSGIQAVRHVGLKIWQMIFYTAGTFSKDSVTVTVDRGCTIMLKGVGTTNVTMSIASHMQSSTPVNVSLNLPNFPQTKQLTCAMPSGNLAGSTVVYNINLPAPPEDTAGSISPIADSYVRNGSSYQGVNYGTATSMVVKTDGSGYTREAFLKFNVADLPSNATQVKLRLYVSYANTSITSVPWIVQYVSNDNWTETGLTWSNMPSATSNIDTVQGVAAGNYVEWDVNAIALAQKAADGILTLKIVSNTTGGTTDASFSSKESGNTAQWPALVYTAAPPLPTPPIADSYVRDGSSYQGVNYGTATTMAVKTDGSGYTREAFLKFNVAGLPSDATQVKLRLYVSHANTSISSVDWIAQYVSNDNWTETGLNWSNKPSATSNIDTVQGVGDGNYVEWDVSAIALAEKAADGILTLKVISNTTGGTTDAYFSSKESTDTTQWPALVYTIGLSPQLTTQPAPALTTQPAILKETTYRGTKVYPVPAGNFVRVQTDRVYKRAELRDGSGHTIKRQVLKGRQQFSIDLQQLPPGLYFLQLSGPDGNETRKLMKL